MTEPEIETSAREAYEAAPRGPDGLQLPWDDLPEFVRNTWRALAAGDAGAVVD